ncbi:MAG: hypothetical protein ACXWB9_11545, partial [Flavisolibacter sp.]
MITTKKQKHKGSGIEVNAKTLMSEQVFVDDYESEKNLFHQYHVSAYRKTKKLNMGASAGFLHDVMPQAQIDHYFTRTPDQLERFQFNSYADVSMGNHILSVRVNGTRQNKTFEQTMNPGSGPSNHLDRYGNHFLYNAEAKLQSIVSDGFINELSVAYAASNNDFSNHYVHTSIPVQSQEAFSEITTNNVQARNTLRYTKHSGSWQFSPAVNFSYRYIRERLYHQLKISSGINPPQISQSISHGGASQFLLTPSVDVSFLNAFNINAGILGDLSNFKGKRIYPFASTSLDVIALAQKESRHSLKIFASYASAGHFYDQAYTMSDLVYNTGFPISTVYGNPISTSPADSSFYSIQAGTVLSLFQNKWQLSYHFDNRDFNALLVVPAQGGSSQVVYPEANSTSHRIQVSVRAIETNQVNWFTSLHANNLFTTVAGYSEFAPNEVEGDVFTETRSWTGGWNNRLTVKNFSLGFDLLAHVNPVIRIGNMVHENENIFALQHAFIGYKFHIRRVKHA